MGQHSWERLVCVLVVCWSCCYLTGFVEASNVTFTTFTDSCTTSFSLRASASVEVPPPSLLRDVNRTSLAFDVRACSDVHVILYAIYLVPRPRASVIQVVLGKQGQSNSTIENCTAHCVENKAVAENPLHCNESRRFGVRWETGDVEVFRVNGNGSWEQFLNYSSTSLVNLHGVSIAYKLNDNKDNVSVSDWTNVSNWTIQTPCADPDVVTKPEGRCQDDTVDSSMVTQGHLAGAVIATLLAGILIGALCVLYGPRLIGYLREANLPWKRQKAEDAQTDEELVELQLPDKPQTSPQPAAATPTPTPARDDSKLHLALPGDNPPPTAAAAAPNTKRKASNAYTPYHHMGGSAEAPKTDTPTTTTAATDVSNPVQRTSSGTGRAATSPLPALPGDNVSPAMMAAAAAPATAGTSQDEVYANADAHIYEGMHQEAPIYENRNTGVYEDLTASGKK
ncbi:hypothetical protein ACOMHN_008656 [Nucella lapillus]